MRATSGAEEEVPLLIAGGGGAGVTSSMLLTRLGVERLLVSARPQASDLPKAHVLNQRAMEMLDDVRVADAMARRSTPAEQMAAAASTPASPAHARSTGAVWRGWGSGGADEGWRAASRGRNWTCCKYAWSRC